MGLAIENVLEKQRLKEEVKSLKQQLAYVEQGNILTSNPQMLRIIDIARHVSGTDVPVLILGESGVGKEVVASFIHEQSNRSEGPFVKVNCAALPHELLESELFGYERGAFTGAIRDKIGKFEQADKGTLLLDEIGEMSPHLQAKLLHVLQDSEFNRLGGKKPVRVPTLDKYIEKTAKAATSAGANYYICCCSRGLYGRRKDATTLGVFRHNCASFRSGQKLCFRDDLMFCE